MLPRYHLCSPVDGALHICDHFRSLALTGLPVPVYSQLGFLRQISQATSTGVAGEALNLGAPSLSACLGFTTPGLKPYSIVEKIIMSCRIKVNWSPQ